MHLYKQQMCHRWIDAVYLEQWIDEYGWFSSGSQGQTRRRVYSCRPRAGPPPTAASRQVEPVPVLHWHHTHQMIHLIQNTYSRSSNTKIFYLCYATVRCLRVGGHFYFPMCRVLFTEMRRINIKTRVYLRNSSDIDKTAATHAPDSAKLVIKFLNDCVN